MKATNRKGVYLGLLEGSSPWWQREAVRHRHGSWSRGWELAFPTRKSELEKAWAFKLSDSILLINEYHFQQGHPPELLVLQLTGLLAGSSLSRWAFLSSLARYMPCSFPRRGQPGPKVHTFMLPSGNLNQFFASPLIFWCLKQRKVTQMKHFAIPSRGSRALKLLLCAFSSQRLPPQVLQLSTVLAGVCRWSSKFKVTEITHSKKLSPS